MEARLVCLVVALQMVIWASATSRPLAPNHAFLAHIPGSASGQRLDSETEPSSSPSSKAASFMGAQVGDEEKENKLGSRPPSCAHKCNGCYPCEAIQVPTTSNRHGRSSVGLQYTNYEPEGWKCKCGPALFSP